MTTYSTLKNTAKATFDSAAQEFSALPSVLNWRRLEQAMFAHQQARSGTPEGNSNAIKALTQAVSDEPDSLKL